MTRYKLLLCSSEGTNAELFCLEKISKSWLYLHEIHMCIYVQYMLEGRFKSKVTLFTKPIKQKVELRNNIYLNLHEISYFST